MWAWRATVLPGPTGTTVQIAARYEVRAPLFAAILFSVGGVAAVALSAGPVWPLIGLFAGVYAFPFLRARHVNRQLSRAGDPEADYLIRRVEEALRRPDARLPRLRPANETLHRTSAARRPYAGLASAR